jgi:hypothetical protein
MADLARGLSAAFKKGEEYAQIHTIKDAIFRSLQIASALAVAWNLPLAWYWQLPSFFLILLLVGMIVTSFRGYRERRASLAKSPYARPINRFQDVYLRTATNVTPEEEYLADLYARGGGEGLFVREGRSGRRTVQRAEMWANEMNKWLRENPVATREEQLDRSRRLLDRMRLSPKDLRIG